MPPRTGLRATAPRPERRAGRERAERGADVRQRTVAAAAALVLLASLLLPNSAHADAEIWTADLVVGSDDTSQGFLTLPPRGSLSDTTFEAGGVAFTFRALFARQEGARAWICVSFQTGYTVDHAAATAVSTLTLDIGGHGLAFERVQQGRYPYYGDYCWFVGESIEDTGFDLGSTLTASIVTSAPQPTAEIVSGPRDATAYRAGEIIRVILSFEEDVRVSGSPQLELEVGALTRLAAHVPARRGPTAAFQYTVTAADADADGVSIRANTDESNPSLVLNDGAFQWVSFLRGEFVHLGFGAVPARARHAVDGPNADTTAPTLSAATVRYDRLVLTYSEPLRSDPQMMSGVATSAWSVTVNGTGVALRSAFPGTLEGVYLVLQSPVDHDDVVTVSSSVLMQDRAATPNTEPALLDGRGVTNETPATRPEVEITADDDEWFEGVPIMLTVTRTGAAADRLRVSVHYSHPLLLGLAFPFVYLEPGENSAQLTVPTKRRRPAGDRPLVISLVPDHAYVIGAAGSASVTVKDADLPVTVSTGASLNIANEADFAGVIDYVSVVAEAEEESDVPPEFRFLFSTEEGTAERNKDYRAVDHRIGFRAEDFVLVPRRLGGQDVELWRAVRRIAIEYLGDDEVEGNEDFTVWLEPDSTTPESVTFFEKPLRVIIVDHDLDIDVAIRDPPERIAENAGQSHIELSATVRQPETRAVSSGVRLTLEEDSATVPGDVAWARSNSKTVSVDLPASLYRQVEENGVTRWRAVISVTLRIHDDDIEEERERFRVRLRKDRQAPNDGYIEIDSATNSARVTIVDDDRRGLVVNPTALDLAPGGQGSYTAALASAPTADVTVTASVPDADAGVVSLSPSTLAFAPENWGAPQSVTVTAAADADGRSVEIANTAAGGDYADVGPVAVAVEIAEGAKQPPLPALAVGDAAASEADAEIAFAVSLDAASTREVTVRYATGNGTADAGADFTGTAGVLTFAAGETRRTVDVPVIDDNAAEPAESFSLRLTAPANAVLGDALGIGRISDDDALPMLSAHDAIASEGADTIDFDVTLSAPSGRAVTVQVRTEDGSAVQGHDYRAVVGEVRFAPGEVHRVIGVPVIDDAVDEVDVETIGFTLSGPANATVADGAGTATGSIRDNDVAPVVSGADTTAAETGGEMVFAVVLTGRTESTVTVDYETVDVSATAGSDYRHESGTLTFAPGEAARSVAVTLLQDALEEGDEVLTLTLDDAQNARLGASGDGTIRDGGAPALRIADATAAEAAGEIEFVVTASGAVAREMRVDYATRDGTATAGLDYTASQDTLVFAVGEAAKTIRVPVLTDALSNEGLETLDVVLSNAANATLADAEATGTISDAALPRLTVSDTSVEEGDDAVFTVSLSDAAAQDVSFRYRTADGSATAGADYTQASGSLTIPAAGTAASITVATAEDGLDEDEETFRFSLEQPLFATIEQGAATGTIRDGDASPTLSVANATADEGESLRFAVTLSAASALEVAVDFETADGTAVSPADYTETTGRLTFAPGVVERVVSVPVYQDRLDEDPEHLALVLKSPTNAGFDGAEEFARGFILDDDASPVLELVVDPIEVSERGETSAVLTVGIVGDSTFAEDTRVDLEVSGPAQAGADYRLTDAGGNALAAPYRLLLPAGAASVTARIQAIDDDVDDDAETVAIQAKLGRANVGSARTLRIADDDEAGVVASPAALTLPEGGTKTYTVALASEPTGNVAVTVSSDNTDVTAGGPLTFTASDWRTPQTVTVTAAQDGDATDDAATLANTAEGGGYGGESADVSVTVTDDETAPTAITLAVSPASVAEDDGATTVTVTATLDGSATLGAATPVRVSVGGGTATSGTDYTAVDAFTVTIPAETASGTGRFTLTPTNDSIAEGEETIDVIGMATGFTVTGAQVALTDDVPSVTVGFARASYTVDEGASVTVTVVLSAVPEREVEVALTHAAQGGTTPADYSGVPDSVTFASDETSQTFSFTAAADDVDDDGESVLLGFGTPLPDRVSAGATAASTVSITDDDVPPVEVFFEPDAYTVAEGSTVTVTVKLSADPEREVAVRLTDAGQDGASGLDYSTPPTRLVFDPGETVQSFPFTAAADGDDDDGESVLLGFGALPDRVSAPDTTARPASATVSITDDDDPAVTVSFGASSYTVAEGGTVTVTVELSAAPEREVEVPITHTAQGDTTAADYSGVPTSITFASDDTEKTFTFTAAADDADDDGDSVLLGFGALPDDVSEGSPDEATVTITDDPADVPSVQVSFGASSYTVAEGSTVTVTVELSAAPEREVEVPLTHTPQDDTTAADYSGVPTSVTFASDDTAKTFTFTAAADEVDDDGDSVLLGFGTPLPASVTAASPTTATVSITDNDDPAVDVSFAQASYTVAEGASVTVTVELSAAPEREVEVPLTHTAQGDTTAADYSGVPTSVTFSSDDTEKTFTFTAAADDEDDDGDSVLLGFGALPDDVSEGSPDEATVTITDDPADVPSVQVSFAQASYSVAEGSTVTVTVDLSAAPERTVEVPLTHTPQGDTTAADYSGVPTSVTFASDDTEKTFTFTAAADDADDDGDSVLLGFGTPLPADVTAGATDQATVSITDNDDPAVTVSFGASSYTVAEGGTVTVTVELSAAPEREVEVPLTHTPQDDTTAADYSGVPTSVTFASDETSQTFTFTAAADDADDDGDSVLLGFGTPLPADVTAGATDQATVSITDNDDPAVTVSFGASSYTVAEGGTVTVTVELSAAPEREVEVQLTHTAQDDTTAADYSGVPTSVTFSSDDTEKTFTFTAAADDEDDDGDSVLLGFGALPTSVSEGSPDEATVTITDDPADVPSVQVSYGASSYTVAEGGSVTVTVELSAAPEREVEVPLTHTPQGDTTAADYSGVPTSVTFASDETSQTFTFTAATDDADDDGDSVLLGFGTPLPASVTAGATDQATVSITDDPADVPAVRVSYGASSYSVAEGSTVTVTVELSAAPEREVEVPLTHTPQGDTTAADYSGVPTSVTFASDDTEKTFTFTAAADDADDDGDSVLLGFGALPDDVSAGATDQATVSITDNDDPAVTVSFGASSYTVAEGGTVTVTVELSAAPERTVEVPLTHTPQGDTTAADYSGVPTSVTFESDDTEKTFTFTAAADNADDDGESVLLGFGTPLPDGVSAGATAASTVSITDDDVPAVEVSYGASSYSVAEGSTVTVTVELSAAPEREVEVPLTHTPQGDTTAADYSGVPTSVTFESDDTEKTFTFTAAADDVDDDGDSVLLGFGTPLPASVTAGATDQATVSITDNDDPAVTVSFGASSYSVAEGSTVTVTVELSAAPERTVEVPLTHTPQDDTTAADYSGVPTSVTFASDDTAKTFTFTAAADEVDDDGDSVLLGFGTPLPASVTAASPTTATVSITDNDDPAVDVSFAQASYTVAEGASVTITVELSAAPEREVEVPLTHTAQGDTTAADYSGVPTSVTFSSDDTEKTFTFTAAADDADDDSDSVLLGFGTPLPDDVSAGATATSTVSITDDDVPSVEVSFGASSYTVAEGASVTVTVELSAAPEREVEVPITHTAQGDTTAADYSGVPTSVTFESDETSQTFTFTAAADDADDDSDSVLLGFGALPDDVSAGATATSTVSITDDDVPSVQVSYGASSYSVAEGGTVTVTVELSAAPEREVEVPITHTPRGDTTTADYSGVPTSVTFASDDTEKTFTFAAAADDADDDGDSVLLGFGTPLPADVTAGATDQATVSITDNDDPAVTVSFGASSYSVAEGSTVTVTVELSAAPERTVEVPLTHTPQGDTTAADYSGVPTSVTFASDDTEKTFTFTAAADDVDDDSDSVLLGFGTPLPDGVTAASPTTATVSITDDDDPQVEVSYSQASYSVAEGGTVTVTVELSAAPEREVEVPLTHTPQDDTTAADYSGVPTSVTFATDDTEKTFTFTAAADDADDDSDSVLLGFGALPDDVSEGSPGEATVTITDDPADVPSVQVSFAQASYTVAEGSTVTVTVELSAAPEREVEVPLTHTAQGDTTAADYSGVPTSVTFASDDTEKTFTFAAAADDADDDGDSVLLGFGTPLPADVTAGATDQATVSITDDDAPQRTVSFDKQFFTVGEGSHRVLMQVDLSGAVNHQVTIPVTTTHGNGTEASDYDLAVTSAEDYYAGNATWTPLHAGLIFTPAETAKIVRVTAVDDSIMEDDEILELGFGTLPEGISPGSIRVATVTITDNDGDANAPPTFDSPPTFEVPENQTSIGTVRASDSDAADEVTGYVMTGGADQALFSIRQTSGVLTFDAAPDFEESRDADGNNAYLLTVQASSGTGSRLKTAEQSITVTVTRLGEEGDFRIVDGPSQFEGRVEVFHAGRWGTVCDDVFRKPKVSVFNYDEDGNLILDSNGNPTETDYANEAPALVCQTMGYETGAYAAGYGQSGVDHQPADYWPPRSSYPASGPLPIWLDDLLCVAGHSGPSVDRLPAPMGHCHYAGWGLHNCTHAEDAGVRCSMESTAQVDGPVLALTWRTPRDGFAAPDGGDFAVRADGAAVGVTDAALVGRHAVLTLAAPVLLGQSVSVDYLGSAMHPLADADGVPVPAWTDLAAENLTGEPEDAQWAAVVALAAARRTAAGGRPALAAHGADPTSLSLAGAGLTDADLAAVWWSGGPRPDRRDAPDAGPRRPETRPVDVFALAGLRRLDLSGNALTDVSLLADLRGLESLDLSGNALTDIAPLSTLTALRRLDLRGNRVADLAPLASLPRLEVLLLDGNRVVDAGALTHLGTLRHLGLADNAVADFAPLSDLWSLRRLDLGGNPATDLSPLGDLETLEWLRVPAANGVPAHRLIRLRWLWTGPVGICLGCGERAP